MQRGNDSLSEACHGPAKLCLAIEEANFLALNPSHLYQMLSNPNVKMPCSRVSLAVLHSASSSDFLDHDCILSLAVDLQDPSLFLKKDVARFLWNFLALRTSSGPAVAADGETAASRPLSHQRRCLRACFPFVQALADLCKGATQVDGLT